MSSKGAMEPKAYFEKILQDNNQHRKGRNLRKYSFEEGIDYRWLVGYIKRLVLSKFPYKHRDHVRNIHALCELLRDCPKAIFLPSGR